MTLSFQELMGPNIIKPLTDSFSRALGLASSIGELDGLRLVSSGDTTLCKQFHRMCPESQDACNYSRTTLVSGLAKGLPYVLFKCKNGLNDAATPIKIRGAHVANFYIGQFLYSPPDIPFFKDQAKKYGFEEMAYLKALEKIPIIEKEQVVRFLDLVTSITGMLGELGLKHLEQMGKSVYEIKLLQSCLPICSLCKKIRDDNGYWQRVEKYIQDHYSASLTHGICPECCRDLYGDEPWYNEIKI